MKCEKCKYMHTIGNTEETGAALCTRKNSYFPVNCKDNCHLIPEKKELCCRDCARLGEDFACFTCREDDKVYDQGMRCWGYIDKNEEKFQEILMFWKVQNMYNRDKIIKMIDEVEDFYNDIENQIIK